MGANEISQNVAVCQISTNTNNRGRENYQLEQVDKFQNKETDSNDTRKDNPQKKANEENITEAVNQANEFFKIVNMKFDYSIHEETNEIIVRVVNEQTDEVIREIPPERMLDMAAKMWELAGILVDERA